MNLALITHIATRFHVPEDRRGCYKVQPRRLKTKLCFRCLSAHHAWFTSAIKFRRRNIGSARLRFRKIDIKAAAIPDEISPIVGTFNCPKRPTASRARTRLRGEISLLSRKMQGDFGKMQRGANCSRAKSGHFSTSCMASPYSRSRETVIALAETFRGSECRIAKHG